MHQGRVHHDNASGGVWGNYENKEDKSQPRTGSSNGTKPNSFNYFHEKKQDNMRKTSFPGHVPGETPYTPQP